VLVSYHPSAGEVGPHDGPRSVLVSRGQTPNVQDNLLVATWNSAEALERVLAQHASDIAAIIMEPVLCNSGCLMPENGYLQRVRDLTRKYGVLLVFDEVITGLRLALGGAQQYYGVTRTWQHWERPLRAEPP
jgi:glutamate-1-semialdehyde 2,1-aminomutase